MPEFTNANFNAIGERIDSLPLGLNELGESFATKLAEKERQKRALENLQKIDHIVVLVMENRSFDHMLGYLSLPADDKWKGRGRTEVNGLTGKEFNVLPVPPPMLDRGKFGKPLKPNRKFVFRLPEEHYRFPIDPPHATVTAVDIQIGGPGRDDPPMGGFVRRFKQTLDDEGADDIDPGLIMGHFTKGDLPTYDFLSEYFAVCDRWFCSVPTGTWPNRMYLYSGTSNGIVTNAEHIYNYGPKYDDMPKTLIFEVLREKNVSWRIYTHTFAWARVYRGFFPRPWEILKFGRFLEACRDGDLKSVTFIDPNWSDVGAQGRANDDHPQDASIFNGQELVRDIYEALRNGKNKLFEKTMFVVTYDEHGGFYDHVVPPPAADLLGLAPNSPLATFGIRVPALVVSPWVPKRSVCHTLFDHASIAKTIYLRFCDDATVDLMGQAAAYRIRAANHLGELLSESTPRQDLPSAASLTFAARGQLREYPPSDLAREMTAARQKALTEGVPEEHL